MPRPPPKVRLTGQDLDLRSLELVARHDAPISVAAASLARVRDRHQDLLRAALWGQPVYGVNRGVGAYKDRPVPARRRAAFERRLVRAHLGGAGRPLSQAAVRASLTVRLNSLLAGSSGARPELARAYVGLLNAGIHPVVPRWGSVGEADITLLAHVGQALFGEGEVHYRGERMSALRALKAAGLSPLNPGPRDGLAMISSNAVSSAQAGLVLIAATHVIEAADRVYALSLEALRGHVSPLYAEIHDHRPSHGARRAAAVMRAALAGSELLRAEPTGTLQNPLSFRVAAHVHGAARDALTTAERAVVGHWNCGEDNPWVTPAGKILVSGAFDPLAWVLPIEGLTLAVAHLGRVVCRRIHRLGEASRTGLTPYLSDGGRLAMGLSELQKTAAALLSDLRAVAAPASLYDEILAEGQEDHSVAAPLAVARAAAAVDSLTHLVGLEAVHAFRAVAQRGSLELGAGTGRLQQLLTHTLSTVWRDRDMTPDLERATDMVRLGMMT